MRTVSSGKCCRARWGMDAIDGSVGASQEETAGHKIGRRQARLTNKYWLRESRTSNV